MIYEGKEYYPMATAVEATGYKKSTLALYFSTKKIPGRKINGDIFFTAVDIAAIRKFKDEGGVATENTPALIPSDAPVKEIAPDPKPLSMPEKKEGIAKVRELLKIPKAGKLVRRNILIPEEDVKTYDCIKQIADIKGIQIGQYLVEQTKINSQDKFEHLKALRL